MNYTIDSARKYLTWYNLRGITYVISGACLWLKEKYIPAVACLEKGNYKKDHELLSDCYYMLGDIHDFNGCPKAAIKAYQKSLRYNPQYSYSIRELASMNHNIGNYQKAVSLITKAVKLHPEDKYSQMDYNIIVNSAQDDKPLYQQDDICWQARELLAREKPKQALKLLQSNSTIDALKTKTCILLIMNENTAALDQFSKLTKTTGLIEFTHFDWFYSTGFIWKSVEYWETIAKLAKANRFNYSIMPSDDNLKDQILDCIAKRKLYSKADLKRLNKYYHAIVQAKIQKIQKKK